MAIARLSFRFLDPKKVCFLAVTKERYRLLPGWSLMKLPRPNSTSYPLVVDMVSIDVDVDETSFRE